jgi:hypothetical protein
MIPPLLSGKACVNWFNSFGYSLLCLHKYSQSLQFSEETRLLLKGTPREPLSALAMKKMKLLSLSDYFDELPLNPSVLLK